MQMRLQRVERIIEGSVFKLEVDLHGKGGGIASKKRSCV